MAVYRPIIDVQELYWFACNTIWFTRYINTVSFEPRCCYIFASFFYEWPSTLSISHKTLSNCTASVLFSKKPTSKLATCTGSPVSCIVVSKRANDLAKFQDQHDELQLIRVVLFKLKIICNSNDYILLVASRQCSVTAVTSNSSHEMYLQNSSHDIHGNPRRC